MVGIRGFGYPALIAILKEKYRATLVTGETFLNDLPELFAVNFSAILRVFTVVCLKFSSPKRPKMAYKGQKVQKVMVQPIVSSYL